MNKFQRWLQGDNTQIESLGFTSETGRQGLMALARSAQEFAEQRFARCGGERITATLACKPGCAWCCNLPVHTSIAELVLIARSCSATLPQDEFVELRNRTREAAKTYQQHLDKGSAGTMQLTCPLLSDNRCLVYESRPLACRGWNSLDVERCKAMLGSIEPVRVPVNQRMRTVYASTAQALDRGLARQSLPTSQVLVLGLSELFDYLYADDLVR